MSEQADSTYVIRTGDEALDRLQLLARLFWPTTERFLTRTEAFDAERFLDVGCGIGDVACRSARAPRMRTLGRGRSAPVRLRRAGPSLGSEQICGHSCVAPSTCGEYATIGEQR